MLNNIIGLEGLHAAQYQENPIWTPLKESNLYDVIKPNTDSLTPIYMVIKDSEISLEQLNLNENMNLNKELIFSKGDAILDFKLKCVSIYEKNEKVKHFNKILGTYIDSLVAGATVNIIQELFENQLINTSSIILCNEIQLREITALKDANGNYIAKKIKGVYHIYDMPIFIVPSIQSISMIELENVLAREVGTSTEIKNDAALIRAGKVGYHMLYDYAITLIDESRIIKVQQNNKA